MRTDETGSKCPATLGEYRELCVGLSPYNENCEAVAFLDRKIAESPNGTDEKVLAADSQMRILLMPLMMQEVGQQTSEAQAIDPGPCPQCGYEGLTREGGIVTVPLGASVNGMTTQCPSCDAWVYIGADGVVEESFLMGMLRR